MWRRQFTRKRLLQLVGLLVAIGVGWVLSLGNYEPGNPTTPTGPTATATSSVSSSAASSSTAP